VDTKRVTQTKTLVAALVTVWSAFGQTYTIYTVAGDGGGGFSGETRYT
jgi:hypothetical protein